MIHMLMSGLEDFVDASSINKRIKRLNAGKWRWSSMHRKEMIYFLSINRILFILYIQTTSFSKNSDELCWLLSALCLRWCLIKWIYFLNRDGIYILTLFWLTLIWELWDFLALTSFENSLLTLELLWTMFVDSSSSSNLKEINCQYNGEKKPTFGI